MPGPTGPQRDQYQWRDRSGEKLRPVQCLDLLQAGQGNPLGLAGWILLAVAPGPGNLRRALSAGHLSPGSRGSCKQLWPLGSSPVVNGYK